MVIRYGFHGADLWTEDDHGYDEHASAAKYADMIQAALEKSYPDAVVVVKYDLHAGGVLPAGIETTVNEWEDHEEVSAVEHIAGQVFETFDWLIKEPVLPQGDAAQSMPKEMKRETE